MDWSTRRSEVRWYLRQHKWWWKWPVVIAIVAIWGAAFALFLRPWQPSPSSIDDTATPPATTDVRDLEIPDDDLPTGLDRAPRPEDVDDAEETESSEVPTMTLEELAASLPPLEEAEAAVVEPTATDESEPAPRSSRRPTRSAPAEAEPTPVPEVPAPIATPPPTTRPRTTTTTVRPSVNTPLPTFSTRPPSSPTTTVRPVPTTTTPPPTTRPPTTPPPTTQPPAPTTVATTLPPAPPPITTAPAIPPLEPVD